MNEGLKIRQYQEGDEVYAQHVHYRAVRTFTDYTQEQIDNFSPANPDTTKWADFLKRHNSLIAEIGDQIVGFGNLTSEGEIKTIYVDPDYMNQGIGGIILSRLEETAKEVNFDKITLSSSLHAVGFYKKYGYKVVEKQIIQFKNVNMEAYYMEKVIG